VSRAKRESERSDFQAKREEHVPSAASVRWEGRDGLFAERSERALDEGHMTESCSAS
jgi:hypothetical protein